MCLIIFSWKNHAKYDLVVASNRDEFFKRPTAPANFWGSNPDLLAGKDLKSGGTWMGITKTKRFAALTNYRDLDRIDVKAPSRGQLVTNFLNGLSTPDEYLSGIKESSDQYNLFNLLVSDGSTLCYFNNVNHEIKTLTPGLYGLSNGLLDEPWPKVLTGKEGLKSVIQQEEINPESIFDFMEDKTLAADELLPKTGVPFGMEKGLSSLFIDLPAYGTRCSSVVLSNQQESIYVEKTYEVANQKPGLSQFKL